MSKSIFFADSIPIVFSSNDFFIPYVSTMIQSIMENASQSNNKYIFFILHKGITDQTTDILKKQIIPYNNFSIDFININQYLNNINFFINNRTDITVETYFRLLIPEIFHEYEKVIYCDGDMVCCTDISQLYHVDLGNNLLASSRDILGIGEFYKKGRRTHRANILKHSNMDNYFIAGMLLINIKLFRNLFTIRQILEFAVSRNWEFHDQDILNVLCEDRVLLLPMSWDLTINDTLADYLPISLKKEYNDAKQNPKIVHFAGSGGKPWLNSFNVPYFELFWKYAARTPFFNIILTRMKENKLIGLTYKECILAYLEKEKMIGLLFLIKCFFVKLSYYIKTFLLCLLKLNRNPHKKNL
jgi:lipopolysaccharide biosynthesis glycosyltransferase